MSNLPEDALSPREEERPLRLARSQAELTRTRNSNVLVCLAIAQFSWNILIGLYILGVI